MLLKIHDNYFKYISDLIINSTNSDPYLIDPISWGNFESIRFAIFIEILRNY